MAILGCLAGILHHSRRELPSRRGLCLAPNNRSYDLTPPSTCSGGEREKKKQSILRPSERRTARRSAPERAGTARRQLRFGEAFEEECRRPVEPLDPWRNIPEPERLRPPNEGAGGTDGNGRNGGVHRPSGGRGGLRGLGGFGEGGLGGVEMMGV